MVIIKVNKTKSTIKEIKDIIKNHLEDSLLVIEENGPEWNILGPDQPFTQCISTGLLGKIFWDSLDSEIPIPVLKVLSKEDYFTSTILSLNPKLDKYHFIINMSVE